MLQQLRRVIRRASRRAPTGEQGQAFYDRRYRDKAHKRLPYHLSHYYPLWSVIADRLRGCGGVLEVGCGAGQLATLLREQGLARYTGFDLSPAAVEIARGQCPDADFHVANAFETDLFTTSDFDTIVCTEVLEHVDHDLELVERWPTGVRCVCSVPDFPARAHVRHFEAADSAAARYAPLFRDLVVTTHVRATERAARFFLLDGIRC